MDNNAQNTVRNIFNKNKRNPEKGVVVKSKKISREDMGYSDKKTKPTFDVNMRLNNHNRNAILSLAKIEGDRVTANNIISDLIDDKVTNLDEQKRMLYDELFKTLEQKDYLSFKVKNKLN